MKTNSHYRPQSNKPKLRFKRAKARKTGTFPTIAKSRSQKNIHTEYLLTMTGVSQQRS